ncbi:MAG: response regulator [Candidatus Omnitrophica bacterium]|jgi:CheY-like chemotaxis protein|nr:response regulator [Candidatus Omnitrophota bacterium]MDD4908836.1 response regulator [Candidatus Omnitrophota bacterium]
MDKKKTRVLVVDDEEDFLKITKLNLEETGEYEVVTLSSAKNIVGDVLACSPDVILMDILMPAVGGIGAVAQLNKDSITQNIPIIIISAANKEIYVNKAYREGVVNYVFKPIDKKDLITKIELALRFKQ